MQKRTPCLKVHSTDEQEPLHICANCCDVVLRFDVLFKRCQAQQEQWKTMASQKESQKCPLCDTFTAASAELLQEHMRQLHCELIFHCDICKQLIERRLLMEHMAEHARVLVDGATSSDDDEQPQRRDADDSISSKSRRSRSSSSPSSANATPQTHHCPDCERSFDTLHARQLHHRSVHPALRKFRCARCPATFRTKHVLENHVRGRHSNVRSFDCAHCPKAFKTDGALWMHQRRLHANTANPSATRAPNGVSCAECGKQFKMRNELVRHLATHSTTKAHACPYCERRFAVRNSLTKHLRTHAALAKEHRCHMCDYAGTERRYLAVHMRTMHQTTVR